MPAPSTTEPLQIKDVSDGVIALKDGSFRGIVQIDAINFELRSSDEQAAIIEQFQGFLNSIDFPLQVVIQSRTYNVQTYLAGIEQSASEIDNELLKLQSQEYVRFIRELSELANIMSKRFYVILSLAVTAATETKGFLSSITGMFKKKPAAAPTPAIPEQDIQNYKMQLQQRADLILGGLSGMGLKGRVLGQEEVLALFSDLYNPSIVAKATEPTTHA